MSTILVDNFQLNSNRPMDNRFVVGPGQFYTSKNDVNYKYIGLRLYDINDSTFYYWNGSSWVAETFGGGGGGTGDITGTGTQYYIPVFTGAKTITVSQIYDNGFNVGFGSTIFPNNQRYKFLNGDVRIENGAIRVDDGNSSTPTYTFETAYNSGSGYGMYYDAGLNSVSFAANSANQLNIIDGQVLLGTQSVYGSRLTVISNDNSDSGKALKIFSNNSTQYADYSWGGVTSTYYYKINSGSGKSIFLNSGFEVTSSGMALISNGAPGAPGLAFQNSLITGLFAPTNGQMSILANGTQKLRFAENDIYANIHNIGVAGIGDSGNDASPYSYPSIASGQFAASVVTGLVNCSSVSSGNYAWIRVGNVVNVTGRVTFTVTSSNSQTEFKLELPIKTNFGIDTGGGNGNNWQLNGVGKVKTHIPTSNGTGGDVASIEAFKIAGISYAYFKFRPSVSGSSYMTFTFQYILGNYPDSYNPPSPPSP